MKLAMYQIDECPTLALVEDEKVASARPVFGTAAEGISSFFQRWGGDLPAAARRAEKGQWQLDWRPLSEDRLLPAADRTVKIIGIGRNYGAHRDEGGLEPQASPRIFFKTANTLAGPRSRLIRPPGIKKLDFEGELVAVVGRPLAGACDEEAAAAIGGYMVGNDLSARELQFDVAPPQTSFAKSMDGFAPVGPYIITADELGTAPDLRIRSWLNDSLMQEGNTGDLLFSVATCLAYVSRYVTLQPGDLLFTGTPAGVGCFRVPPVFLTAGDRVRVTIDDIGEIVTEIV